MLRFCGFAQCVCRLPELVPLILVPRVFLVSSRFGSRTGLPFPRKRGLAFMKPCPLKREHPLSPKRQNCGRGVWRGGVGTGGYDIQLKDSTVSSILRNAVQNTWTPQERDRHVCARASLRLRQSLCCSVFLLRFCIERRTTH